MEEIEVEGVLDGRNKQHRAQHQTAHHNLNSRKYSFRRIRSMPTKPVTPAVNNDTFSDSNDDDLSDIKITCSFNFDEVVTRQSAPSPDARSSDTRFSDFEKEKPALVKSISREENWARLFGIITASAAAVVSPVIMIGAVFWTIGNELTRFSTFFQNIMSHVLHISNCHLCISQEFIKTWIVS